MPSKPDLRTRELAKIHVGAKYLGMDRETYTAMLNTVAGVNSAADLDATGRRKVVEHLKGLGVVFNQRKRTKPAASKAALIAKIQAMLIEVGRPDSYADGIARQMFGIDRFEWAEPEQLRKIVAALYYDKKRRGGRND